MKTPSSTLPDIIGHDLRMLLVGINPSIVSAECGHHYAGKGNGFWRALHAAGITPRLLHFTEDRSLLDLGVGSTNLVHRPTRGSAELTDLQELRDGLRGLEAKVAHFRPQLVVLLCKTVFNRAAGSTRRAQRWGPVKDWRMAGAKVHVLPNPSGRNNGRRGILVRGLQTAWQATQ